MRTLKKFSFAAGALASALLLSACAGGNGEDSAGSANGGEAEEGPIQVVVLGGLGAEGILQDNATTSITAARASVNKVNEEGGILGRQVELQVIDDTADPTVAVTRLRELFSTGEKPVLVMNSGPSTIPDATIPIMTQEKVLSFNIGPTATSSDPSVSPYNFDLTPTVPDYLGSFVEELTSRGYEKVAVLHGSSSYGETFGAEAERTFTEAGIEVTGVAGYDNAALDMTPQIESLRAGDPDAVILDSYGAPLGYVLDGFEKIGWDVPIVGNNSVAATSLIATEPPAGVLGTSQVENLTMQVFNSTRYDENDEKVIEAVERMLDAGDIRSSLILAYNYDSMALLKAAAESANSLEAEALAEALRDPAVQQAADTAILKNYGFTEDFHGPNTQPEEFRFISPGLMVNGQYHSE